MECLSHYIRQGGLDQLSSFRPLGIGHLQSINGLDTLACHRNQTSVDQSFAVPLVREASSEVDVHAGPGGRAGSGPVVLRTKRTKGGRIGDDDREVEVEGARVHSAISRTRYLASALQGHLLLIFSSPQIYALQSA